MEQVVIARKGHMGGGTGRVLAVAGVSIIRGVATPGTNAR